MFQIARLCSKNFFEEDAKKNGIYLDKLFIRSRTFKKDLNEGKKQTPFRQVFKSDKESQRFKISPKFQESFQKFKTRTIGLRKNDLHSCFDLKVHSLDDFRKSSGVDFVS